MIPIILTKLGRLMAIKLQAGLVIATSEDEIRDLAIENAKLNVSALGMMGFITEEQVTLISDEPEYKDIFIRHYVSAADKLEALFRPSLDGILRNAIDKAPDDRRIDLEKVDWTEVDFSDDFSVTENKNPNLTKVPENLIEDAKKIVAETMLAASREGRIFTEKSLGVTLLIDQ